MIEAVLRVTHWFSTVFLLNNRLSFIFVLLSRCPLSSSFWLTYCAVLCLAIVRLASALYFLQIFVFFLLMIDGLLLLFLTPSLQLLLLLRQQRHFYSRPTRSPTRSPFPSFFDVVKQKKKTHFNLLCLLDILSGRAIRFFFFFDSLVMN